MINAIQIILASLSLISLIVIACTVITDYTPFKDKFLIKPGFMILVISVAVNIYIAVVAK
jgi:hypothetical protein